MQTTLSNVYMQVFADWHEASDGRGRDQDWREATHRRVIQYLLDEFMPYHRPADLDLSQLDINRLEFILFFNYT